MKIQISPVNEAMGNCQTEKHLILFGTPAFLSGFCIERKEKFAAGCINHTLIICGRAHVGGLCPCGHLPEERTRLQIQGIDHVICSDVGALTHDQWRSLNEIVGLESPAFLACLAIECFDKLAVSTCDNDIPHDRTR